VDELTMNNPTVFWCISIFLLLWGAAYLGLVTFTVFIATPDHWATLVSEGRIKAEYAVYISEIPVWAIGITVVAALTGLFGGVALLMHKSLAFPLYGVSLILVAVIMFRGFVLADVASVIRGSQVVLEIGFLMISTFAVWFAYANTKNGALS
jgi:hypothetical protein